MFKTSQTSFSCNLKKFRCKGKTKANTRCKRFSYFGYPFCWYHMSKYSNLRIKKSSVINGGLGLFVSNGHTYNKGDKIVEYVGEILTKDEIDRRYSDSTAPYTLMDGTGKYIDSACFRGIASMANAPDKTHEKNADFVDVDDVVMIVATKKIVDGDEIFVDYGDEYLINDETETFKTIYRQR